MYESDNPSSRGWRSLIEAHRAPASSLKAQISGQVRTSDHEPQRRGGQRARRLENSGKRDRGKTEDIRVPQSIIRGYASNGDSSARTSVRVCRCGLMRRQRQQPKFKQGIQHGCEVKLQEKDLAKKRMPKHPSDPCELRRYWVIGYA